MCSLSLKGHGQGHRKRILLRSTNSLCYYSLSTNPIHRQVFRHTRLSAFTTRNLHKSEYYKPCINHEQGFALIISKVRLGVVCRELDIPLSGQLDSYIVIMHTTQFRGLSAMVYTYRTGAKIQQSSMQCATRVITLKYPGSNRGLHLVRQYPRRYVSRV